MKKAIINLAKNIFKLNDVFNYMYNLAFFKYFHVKHSNFQIKGRISISGKGTIIIGDDFGANSGKMNNPIGGDSCLRLVCQKGGTLIIGNNVGMSNTTIVCWNEIIIEDNVRIGGGSKIWDTNFHSLDYKDRIFKGDKNIKTERVLIRENSFIGGASILLKGISIGKNSIVAAGSVVVKNIPDNQIWGGNPAKFIRNI